MSATGAREHFANTTTATENRTRKATALAATAVHLGYLPYELTLVGGTVADSDRRTRVWKATGLVRSPSVETWRLALTEVERALWAAPNVTACSACGWPVRDVVTASGLRIALDPFSRADGTVYAQPAPRGGKPVAVVLAGGTEPPDEPLYRQHSRSCPERSDKTAREAPRCPICSRALDSVLAARDRTYATHPTCSPGGG